MVGASEPPPESSPTRLLSDVDKPSRTEYARRYKRQWRAALPPATRRGLRREEGYERRLTDFAPLFFHFPDGKMSQARVIRAKGTLELRPSRVRFPRMRAAYFGTRLSEPFPFSTLARFDPVSTARDTLLGVAVDNYYHAQLRAHAFGLAVITWAYFASITSRRVDGARPAGITALRRFGWSVLAEWITTANYQPLNLLWAIALNHREARLIPKLLASSTKITLPIFRYHAALATCVARQIFRSAPGVYERFQRYYPIDNPHRYALPYKMSKSFLIEAWGRDLSMKEVFELKDTNSELPLPDVRTRRLGLRATDPSQSLVSEVG